MNTNRFQLLFLGLFKFLSVLGLLYLFLSAISILDVAFKLLGSNFSENLINTTANPFIGLLIGIISTALIQSSSVTTSMVVGMVSAGSLSITGAVPIVMGANIGTTITSVLVSFGHISNKHEFRRAFAGATMHDFFNLITVLLLFPLEMATHFLQKIATFFAGIFYGTQVNSSYQSPIKTATKIIAKFLNHFLSKELMIPEKVSGAICLIIAFFFIFLALFLLVKIMRSVMLARVERVLNQFLNQNILLTMFIGLFITVLVQSSSITTSLLIPLFGAGVISLEAAFPITVGANIGTTVTALLASLAGNVAGLTIAFVHLFFNITGTLIILPVRQIRRIPVYLSVRFARIVSTKRYLALVYVLVTFFILPLSFIFISKLF
ncbi:MAG: Na/Pi symporter [Candidatus Margulisbacteria bacterium]|nr:Na/Pi symporter [Candidatus Margulisiibacteriota bacterium]